MATPLKPWELRGRGGGGPESVGRKDGQTTPRPRSGGPSSPPVVPPRPANTVGRCMKHFQRFWYVQGVCWDLQLIESSVAVCTELILKSPHMNPLGLGVGLLVVCVF